MGCDIRAEAWLREWDLALMEPRGCPPLTSCAERSFRSLRWSSLPSVQERRTHIRRVTPTYLAMTGPALQTANLKLRGYPLSGHKKGQQFS